MLAADVDSAAMATQAQRVVAAQPAVTTAAAIPRKKHSLEAEEPAEERRQKARAQEDLQAATSSSVDVSTLQPSSHQNMTAEVSAQAEPPERPPAWLGKRDYFFRKWDRAVRRQLQMDEVASFSVTACDIADRMARELRQLQPDPRHRWRVIDGTACVGGNTIAFSNVFKHVYAVEIDEARCEMLRNNVSVLGCKNVTCMCADFVQALPDLPDCELLFLDPEWGGPEYVNLERISLQVGGQPLANLCEVAFATKPSLQMVALKVPVNFDLEAFTQDLRLAERPIVKEYRKMLMLVLRRTMLTSSRASRST